MKTIIVTTGGTIEPIDGVRGITNFSSGKLGVKIAETFSKTNKVILIRGKRAPHAKNHQNLQEIEITDAQSVVDTLDNLSKTIKADVFIHAMAVADYTVNSISDVDTIINNLAQNPHFTLEDVRRELTLNDTKQNKISSTIKEPVLVLKQTPKIIQLIKQYWESTTLVGFKLLNQVSEEELCQVALNSRKKSNADYVLANDLKNIKGEQHQAILLDKQGNKIYANTKDEIANVLYNTLG